MEVQASNRPAMLCQALQQPPASALSLSQQLHPMLVASTADQKPAACSDSLKVMEGITGADRSGD